MRTILLAATAAATFLATPASAATRNFGITSFEKVRVDGPFKVRLKTGVAPFARATGSPAALDRVAIDVLGKTLVVHNNLSGWGGYPGKDWGPVEIELGTHDLTSASLNGAGALAIDRVKGLSFDLALQGSGLAEIGQVRVDQLKVALTGTASARLAGQAPRLTAVVRGVSSLEASQLSVKDATLGAEGASTIAASVSNSATVDASGPTTVRLSGRPSCTSRLRGSASVSGCR